MNPIPHEYPVALNGAAEDLGFSPLYPILIGGVLGFFGNKKSPMVGAAAGAMLGALLNYWTAPCWTGVLSQFSDCRKLGGCK